MPFGNPGGKGELFGLVLTTDAMAAATGDIAWLRAMLAFESGLAASQAGEGIVPAEVAERVGLVCGDALGFDVEALGRGGRLTGTPAVGLVGELRRRVGDQAARWVHLGSTSQDVVDSAMMLVLRDALDILLSDLMRAAQAAGRLASQYRSTPMLARTLLQPAGPTTFGRKVAVWLLMLLEAHGSLAEVRAGGLALQLGGPAGTAGPDGPIGPHVAAALSAYLELPNPGLPWHTDRSRLVRAASALATCAGCAGKVARDVALLMQNEVGEVAEPAAPGRGGSSSMPQKRNPAMAACAIAAWHWAQGCHAVLLASMAQEHERALGTWQAEPQAISELCRATGGAVSNVAEMLEGLEVFPDNMARNIALAGQTSVVPEDGELTIGAALQLLEEKTRA